MLEGGTLETGTSRGTLEGAAAAEGEILGGGGGGGIDDGSFLLTLSGNCSFILSC